MREVMSPSPTQSELGPAPSPPFRKGRAVLRPLQPPPPPAAASPTELRDEDGDAACRRAPSQPGLRSLGSQKTQQQSSRSRSVRFESPAGALALAADSGTRMKAMGMAWGDADGVTDAWAAAKFAATAAAEAQAAAATAAQAAEQAQKAALIATERAEALDRAATPQPRPAPQPADLAALLPPSALEAAPPPSAVEHGTSPARAPSGSLRSSMSFVRKGVRKGASTAHRPSRSSPPALSQSRSSKRCIGLTPFREEREQHAQQAWLQDAEERAEAADAEALREDAAHQPVAKPPAASEGDPPMPPPRATSLSSGTRKAAAGVRELSEGAAFLMQLRAIGRAMS